MGSLTYISPMYRYLAYAQVAIGMITRVRSGIRDYIARGKGRIKVNKSKMTNICKWSSKVI